MIDLATKTPREIDAHLGELYGKVHNAHARIARALEGCHRATGEKRDNWNKRNPWKTTHPQAEAAARALVAAGHESKPWDSHRPAQVIADLDAARAELSALLDEEVIYESEYDRRPWSRFFLVTSSNGHIHKDMRCSTCRPTTEYGWLPELSGKTEADAVADQGTILCSVCFPTAPVAWTLGKTVEGRCSGGGKAPAGEVNRSYRTPFAECSGCGTNQDITQAGVIRQHKTPKGAKPVG